MCVIALFRHSCSTLISYFDVRLHFLVSTDVTPRTEYRFPRVYMFLLWSTPLTFLSYWKVENVIFSSAILLSVPPWAAESLLWGGGNFPTAKCGLYQQVQQDIPELALSHTTFPEFFCITSPFCTRTIHLISHAYWSEVAIPYNMMDADTVAVSHWIRCQTR